MPIAQFPASTGSKHDPLPEGRWTVLGVAVNPDYRYNPKSRKGKDAPLRSRPSSRSSSTRAAWGNPAG